MAGRLGGRRLVAPSGPHTRPTSDRVREALFSSIESLVDVEGTRFADLYAGSGAVGLEALSRGAAHVLLVESEPKAARVARTNMAALGAGPAVRLLVTSVRVALAAGPGEDGPYDVVFADPPYAAVDPQIATMQRALVDEGWLAPGGLLVIERSSRSAPMQWVTSVTELRTRRYGETTLWYGRRS